MLNEKQLAEMLAVSVRTLQKWRLLGKGPRFYKLAGDAVRYRLDEVEAWIGQQVPEP